MMQAAIWVQPIQFITRLGATLLIQDCRMRNPPPLAHLFPEKRRKAGRRL